jgi:hypothetical protein
VDALVTRDADGGLGLVELERLGTAAYLCGQEDLCEDAWTRSHRLSVEQNDWSRAARTAFWIWYVKANCGQVAVGGGWLARGQRILEEHDSERALPEQGWFHIPTGLRLQHRRTDRRSTPEQHLREARRLVADGCGRDRPRARTDANEGMTIAQHR